MDDQTDWVVALKIETLLLDYISLTIHQQPTTCWLQSLVLAALLVSQWGDRKAWCSSCQCDLVLITTSLSLQQTACSLACHFGDNAINQIWTSSSCSHITFPTSSTRTVILLSKPKVWQTSAVRFIIWVEQKLMYKVQASLFLSINTSLFIRAKQIINPFN